MTSSFSSHHLAFAMLASVLAGFGVGRLTEVVESRERPAATASAQPAPQAVRNARSVTDAVELNSAAVDTLIASGLSGETELMLFTPFSQAQWAQRIQELQKDGISKEYQRFTDAQLRASEHWHLLMKAALGRSGHLRGKGNREDEARILESLVNIARANAAPGRPEFGRLLAFRLLEEIDETKRKRERLDP